MQPIESLQLTVSREMRALLDFLEYSEKELEKAKRKLGISEIQDGRTTAISTTTKLKLKNNV